jgi:hypothetical protein
MGWFDDVQETASKPYDALGKGFDSAYKWFNPGKAYYPALAQSPSEGMAGVADSAIDAMMGDGTAPQESSGQQVRGANPFLGQY